MSQRKPTNVYFISDLHLGAPYVENTHDAERRVAAFLDSIKDDAEEIYLLGDILDYWFEYKYCVPRGFVRFLGKLAELSDAGIKITWLIGNHDIWIFDYLPAEIGISVADGPIIRNIKGHKFLLAHGDGLNNSPLSFKLIRFIFRNKVCQKLFSAVHPRWTVPIARGWSKSSREADKDDANLTEQLYAGLKDFSRKMLSVQSDIEYFIFGHLHILRKEKISGTDAEIAVIGDWLHSFSYGVFDGTTFRLERIKE